MEKIKDMIYRQDAIDALDEIESEVADGDGFQYEKWRKYFCEIPSARQDHIADGGKIDCISRQAAIDALMAEPLKCDDSSVWESARCHQWMMDMDVIKALPSAQPEPVCINLNEPIKVKLTDWGKEIYYHQYDRTNQIAGREVCKPKFPKEDENGYTEFQLWCFIELYGEHIGMTLPNVIEPLEIVYEVRQDDQKTI